MRASRCGTPVLHGAAGNGSGETENPPVALSCLSQGRADTVAPDTSCSNRAVGGRCTITSTRGERVMATAA